MNPGMTDSYRVRRLGADEAVRCIEPLAEVLLDCVEGGASVSFMWPLPRERALGFWRGVAEGVARGERVLLVAEEPGGSIVGTAQLILSQPDNQPHRAQHLVIQTAKARIGV